MNSLALIGRLTADPAIRTTKDGSAVVTVRLAVPRTPGSREAVFVDVTCFDHLAEAVARHLDQGRRVAVEGRLEQREWVDANGVHQERHSVVAHRMDFLGRTTRRARAATEGGPSC